MTARAEAGRSSASSAAAGPTSRCSRRRMAVLDELGVPCELRVVSAHRTPDHLFRYAETAAGRGIRVIIAGAGGAAHLPGMLAAKTALPVIGVPIPTQHLGGLDSLLSIVQMPRGIPVATVAIGNAENAGAAGGRDPRPGGPRLAERWRPAVRRRRRRSWRHVERRAAAGTQPSGCRSPPSRCPTDARRRSRPPGLARPVSAPLDPDWLRPLAPHRSRPFRLAGTIPTIVLWAATSQAIGHRLRSARSGPPGPSR